MPDLDWKIPDTPPEGLGDHFLAVATVKWVFDVAPHRVQDFHDWLSENEAPLSQELASAAVGVGCAVGFSIAGVGSGVTTGTTTRGSGVAVGVGTITIFSGVGLIEGENHEGLKCHAVNTSNAPNIARELTNNGA